MSSVAPPPDKIVIYRRTEFHDSIGKFYTHRVDVRVDEKLSVLMREFIQDGKHADLFEIKDTETI